MKNPSLLKKTLRPLSASVALLFALPSPSPCAPDAEKSAPLATLSPEATANIAALIQKARSGDAEAQLTLGRGHFVGRCVEHNFEQAVFWYRKAAEQGNMSAQFCLGQCYDLGAGVKKDAKQAVFWYRKAAEQGHDWSQFALGRCYANGIGVEKDKKQAAFWVRKAAEQNDVDAQYELGLCYFYNVGVERDETQALFWHRKAAEQNHVQAQTFLTHLIKDEIESLAWHYVATNNAKNKGEKLGDWSEWKDKIEAKVGSSGVTLAQKRAQEISAEIEKKIAARNRRGAKS
jgi:TPR repeat protein